MEAQEGRLRERLYEGPSKAQGLTLEQAGNLEGSGLDAVLATTMYAIVGAVALHRGGDHANKLVKEQILIDFRR